MRVELPGGTIIQVHGLRGGVDGDNEPDWALYLDDRWRERSIQWPCRFVDWPNFDLPTDEPDAFGAFAEAWRRAQGGRLVDIACHGGIGRTGTALACVAFIAGVPASDAVNWVRRHYDPGAIETEDQERLVDRFGSGPVTMRIMIGASERHALSPRY